MLNWVLSILVEKEIISFEEAENLSKELAVKTHPSQFADAHRVMQKVFDDIKKDY